MNKPIESLYVHIPFCRSLCHYCDFPKLLVIDSFIKPYLLSLKKEIESYHINKNLKTVYIGGGTPTSLSDEQFSFLLDMLDEFTQNIIEYTIEANPESLTKSKLEIMKAHGVNRLSIGVESTDDEILKTINRLHTFDDVKKAYLEARELGFNNISFDIIIGLPNVTDEMLIKDIKNLIELNPEHISCYSLTVHENTVMGIKGIEPASDDEMRDKYDVVNKILTEAGYIHYEVSNWCKPNKESKHNLTYWKDEYFYGVGLGASGYVDDYRYDNTKSINEYIKGKCVSQRGYVDPKDDFSYLMLALRTIFGINYQEYNDRFHKDFLKKYLPKIKSNNYEKYFVFESENAHLTYEGMMILDKILIDITFE